MRKTFAIVVSALLLFGCINVVSAQVKYKPGRYNCSYYAKGKDNICPIDINWKGMATTECTFLSLDLVKMLLDSNKCTFIPYKYYSCTYGKDKYCEVGLSPNEKDSFALCEGGVSAKKAISDIKAGKCTPISESEIEYELEE